MSMTEVSFVSAFELGEGDEFELGGAIYIVTTVQKNKIDDSVIIHAYQALNYTRTCTIAVNRETAFKIYL